MSKIEWTEKTWNPTTGCSRISSRCQHCYAQKMARRLKAMGQPKYREGFDVVYHRKELERPASWKKPNMVFVNSMSDLFHKEIPVSFVQDVFETMNSTDLHTYQVLTKRSDRLLEMNDDLKWNRNIWMGVSVENAQYQHRIEDLRQTNASVKFLSLEPLLGPLHDLNLEGIDWVIVGGESGPGFRLMKPEWVRSIRDLCVKTITPFFFKQWGGVNKKKAGRILDGRTWDEMPAVVTSRIN